jgi:hypothetical protein
MTDFACIYPDREAALVAYLYDDIEPAERVAFETHVMSCLACRAEIAEMRGVRSTLAHWNAPAPRSLQSPVTSRQPRVAWWQGVPVWAQAAAAMLVLGVSASIANLDIRYDRGHGVNVTTGWSKPVAQTPQTPPQTPVADAAPWRAELAAMRDELQTEMRAQAANARAASTSAAPVSKVAAMDADVLKRVGAMIDQSEKRQEQQLALHLVQLQKDISAQRSSDVRRTNQLLHDVMNTYGDEIAKQQRQINYLLPAAVPASQQR